VPLGGGGTGDEFTASLFAAGEDAADSATAAASARDAAAAFATQAEAAQAAAFASQGAASLSEAAAAASALQAATSEVVAEGYCVAAEASATAAAASETAAFASQTEASASEAAAAASASEAASSAVAAAAGRDATLAALDSFDDRYLGAKDSPPALDNDGDPLIAGALYYDTVGEAIKLWTGVAWVAAYVSGDGFLTSANNLSDLANVAAARSALGLATVAATGAYDDLVGKPAVTSGGLGVGQTVQEFAFGTTRISGVTYTNTTGKTIFVSVAISSGAVSAVVDGMTVSNWAYHAAFPVPAGSSYAVTTAAASAKWTELR
jgi:hypothetical protein